MTVPSPEWRVKSRPCQFHRKGNCLFGESCNFVHTDPNTWSPLDATLVNSPTRPKAARNIPDKSSTPDSARSQQLNELLDALRDVIGDGDDLANEEEPEENVPPSPQLSDLSGLLSPVDVSGLQLTSLRHEPATSFDSLDSGYESWHTPEPMLRSPPRSPSVASTFELLSSPFGSPTSRLMSVLGRDRNSVGSFSSSFSSIGNEDVPPCDLSLDSPSSPTEPLSSETAPEPAQAEETDLFDRIPSNTNHMLSSEVPKDDEVPDSSGSTSRWDAPENPTMIYVGTPTDADISMALQRAEASPVQYLDDGDCAFNEDEVEAESSMILPSPLPEDDEDATARLPYDSFSSDDQSEEDDTDDEDDTIDSFFPTEQAEDDTISSLYDVYTSDSEEATPTEDIASPLPPVSPAPPLLRERVFTPPPIIPERQRSRTITQHDVSPIPLAAPFSVPVTTATPPDILPLRKPTTPTTASHTTSPNNRKHIPSRLDLSRQDSPESSTKVPFGFRSASAGLKQTRNPSISSLSISSSQVPQSSPPTVQRFSIQPISPTRKGLRPLRLSTLLTNPNDFELPISPSPSPSPPSPSPSLSGLRHRSQQQQIGHRTSISTSSVSSSSSSCSLTDNPLLSEPPTPSSSLIPSSSSSNNNTTNSFISISSSPGKVVHLQSAPSRVAASELPPRPQTQTQHQNQNQNRNWGAAPRSASALALSHPHPSRHSISASASHQYHHSLPTTTTTGRFRPRVNISDNDSDEEDGDHTARPPPPPLPLRPRPSQRLASSPLPSPSPTSSSGFRTGEGPRSSVSAPVSASGRQTPKPTLLFAVASDDPEEVRKVLQESGDANERVGLVGVNEPLGPNDQSALAFAVGNEQLKNKLGILKVLLGFGADPQVVMKGGGVGRELDRACSYYLHRASNPLTRRLAVLMHRSPFSSLTRLRYEIVGQDRMLEQLYRVLSIHSHSATASSGAPLVMLLCGPSGLGKSLLARRIGAHLNAPSHTVNMTTLRSAHDLWQSYSLEEDDPRCTLLEFLSNNEGRRCVVVLDEIEKTEDRKLWSLLVPWELGRCTIDGNSRSIDVRNVIWIATSNIGHDIVPQFCQARAAHPKVPITREEYIALTESLREPVSDALGESILSRITILLPFLPFSLDEKRVLATESILSMMAPGGEHFECANPNAVVEAAVAESHTEDARSLYRAVSNHLVDSLDLE